MKPDKQHLIHDLLDGEHDGRRETILLAGAQILRRRRQRRGVSRGLAFVMVLAVIGFWIELTNSHKPSAKLPAQTAVSPEPVRPQALTDDQLLALFPNTPVGLATLADGRKLLLFPRPGDEQKFITRL